MCLQSFSQHVVAKEQLMIPPKIPFLKDWFNAKIHSIKSQGTGNNERQGREKDRG